MPMSPRLLRPRSAATAAFSPLSISGVAGWWDASDASTVTLNGTAVSEFRNKVPANPWHFAQATAASQPSYSTAARNGLNALSFPTTIDRNMVYVVNAQQSVPVYTVSEMSILYAIVPSATSLNQSRVYTHNPPLNNDFSGTGHFIPPYFGATTNTSVYANGATQASASFVAGTPSVMSFIHTGSSFNYRFNRGTLRAGSSTLSNTPFGRIVLGWFGNSFAGLILEVIVLLRAVSEQERTTLEQYLANKWAITVAP